MPHHSWAWKPDVIAGCMLAGTAALYGIGLWRMTRTDRATGVPSLEIAASCAAWLILVMSLLSPIATISEWLFAMHMTQHELLMLVAAPLLAIGRPVVPMLWALPRQWRRTTRRSRAGVTLLTSPLTVFLLHALALWIWHVPQLYEAAVRDDRVHILQHVSFTVTAGLFWWSLIRGRYGRLGYGAALLFVFATSAHSGGLGALLALSPTPWYPLYVERASSAALALEDQQLGGLIMWVPSGVVMMLLGLALFTAWLGEGERRRRRGWSS